MLNEIRDIVHPLFSSVPPPELDRKQLLKKIKITTADLPRPHLRTRGQPTINVTTSTTGRNDNTNDGGDILPHPVVRYAHGKGCVYSDKPDIVVKSAEFVKTVDAFARTRLDNLTRLLDAGITYVDNDLELACTRNETSTPTSSAASTSPSSASPSETESDSDFDTNTTTTSFTSSSARRGVEDDGHADLDISLTRLFARLAANEVTDKMRSEQIRLQACLATSSLAKGLYWKRCNGVFRNALDDELLPASISITASTTTGDSAGEAMGDDKEANATVDVTLKTTHVDASETNEATKNPFALTSTTTDEANNAMKATSISLVTPGDGHHHRAQTVSGYGYAVLAPMRALAQSRLKTSGTKSQASVNALSPGSFSIDTPPFSAPTSISTSAQFSGISSRFPPLGSDTSGEEKQGDCDVPSARAENEQGQDSEYARIHLVRTNPETFTFTSSILMNREAMVRSGAVDDDDLCLTGWGYNRLEKRVKGNVD